LSALSHELRTPMSVIIGWLNLLRMGTLTKDKVEHAYVVMERYAQQEVDLINDLLDISRMERGHVNLSFAEVDLNQLVERIAAGFTVVGQKADVAIDLVSTPEPMRVIGDLTRLEQILSNVLANAVKFTPRGGHVRVSVVPSGHDAVIRIRDTGRGIAPGFLLYVFDKFRQENSSPKKDVGGLGLGLAIVKRLVELHQGDVQVTSEGVGLGTEVIITLPLSDGFRITFGEPRLT